MVKNVKGFVKKNFKYFSYFYSYLHHRVFIAFSLSFIVGILDGFGLAMFFPLLEMVSGQGDVTSEGLGGLSFLIEGIEAIGIVLNFYSVLIIIAFFFLLKGVAKLAEQYYNVVTQQYFIKKLRYDSVNKLSNLKYKAFVMSDVGRIQNTLSGEVERMSQAYKFYFMALQAGVLVFVYIILAVFADSRFAVLVVIGGGLSNMVYNRIYKKTKETSKKITTGGHEFQGLLIQLVAFFKYFKATGSIGEYTGKLKSSIDYIERSTRRIGFYNSILTATREPLVIIVVVTVIIIQFTFFSESIGAIILSLMFFYRSLNALMQMQTSWNGFLNMSGSLSNTTEFMNDLAREQDTNGSTPITGIQSDIELKSIYFSYGGKRVLKDISLSIPKNQTVAFIGESGSGKTTLVNLIAGLMPIDNGVVTIDQIPLSTLDVRTYQKRIGYITQEPVIFSDTIFNNITFWAARTSENEERFWKALSKASIDEFVKGLPEQENSQLGNNGILVSGGQKQRLSIARELYKDIDILIMDEATSALDSETEKVIQDNIDLLKGKYTILVVAHRLSTIRNADRIVILRDGEIIDQGDYQTLLNTSMLFKKMVSLQEI